MRNFVKSSLIMVSSFVVIHLIAYLVQFNNIDQNNRAIQLKKTKVSMLTNIIQEQKKTCLLGREEIKPEKNSLRYSVPHLKIAEPKKVAEVKILPSGEMTP